MPFRNNGPKTDVRFIPTDGVEFREGQEGEESYVEGIGVVYDREVEIFPGFFETIERGALEGSLRSEEVIKSFFNHDPGAVLSTTRSNPRLELTDDSAGLRFRSPIPPTSYGNDLRENLKRGNVSGASFSFRVDEDGGDEWTYSNDGSVHRKVKRAKLYEVGPVTNPAYASTSANLRSAEALYKEATAKQAEEMRKVEAERENEINLARMQIDLI